MKIYLSALLVLAMASCSNGEDYSALDSNKVVGRISDKSELLRIERLSSENDEIAMYQMVLHLQASGRWAEARKICDRGAELKYEKMLYCSSAYKFEEGGIRNCNAVVNNFQLLQKIVHDEKIIRRYQVAMGIDIHDGRAVCSDTWGIGSASSEQ